MGRARTNPAPTAPATARGRRTHDALIAAGREIIEEQGWAGFTPEAVTQAAGVSYGTFYTYFESKDDLLRKIVKAAADEMIAASRVPDLDDPYARIVEANRRYLAATGKAAKVLRMVEHGAYLDDNLRGLLLEIREFYVRRSEEGIRRLQTAGLADPGLDPHLTAIALGGMVEQVAVIINELREPLDTEKMVDHLSRLWASAIGLRPPVG
ncbi:TetR family transcriptional regulator [Actinoplanes philippinensis]|uniref:DNA-binding transcriptional regulator, AcrR family n=1 Tax=Actinoplanes philippinensis TaxID=35752 RepID=A0A1I2G0C6_9ACTN|nr:TetR/AcrR family transcriptional regulator [Actinoplanes philippinensis]GIE76457.1 TetR family transcriptional regulator [Actinoplanes philippinensis]SFF10527.1 DNA-binding transcriptional regulator, AcrR family [Actinoplanes philippinensis]